MPTIYETANSFLSRNSGLYRSTNYNVIITPPPALGVRGDPRQVSFLCNVAELPQFTINAIETRIHTVTNLMPNARLYANQTTLSFFVFNEMVEKRFFDDWMDSIFYPDNNIRYADEFKSDMTVEALKAGTNEVIYSVTFEEVFPRNIGPLGLGYAQNNDIPQIQVTFAYESWRVNN